MTIDSVTLNSIALFLILLIIVHECYTGVVGFMLACSNIRYVKPC